MATAGYVIAGIFALGVVVAIAMYFSWSISTQHRDHGVASSGPITRRRIWARRPARAHAGPVNSEAIPSADPEDHVVGSTPQRL